MTERTPADAHDTDEVQTPSMNEENPPTVPKGIAVYGMACVKYEPRVSNEVLITTGYLGAGRTDAVRAPRGLDWYIADNPPPTMLPALVSMVLSGPTTGMHRLAVGVDVRSRTFFRTLDVTLEQLKGAGVIYRAISLGANPEAPVRRYESNHRLYPLQGADTPIDRIRAEMRLLASPRHTTDEVIDTSTMSIHGLTRRAHDIVAGEKRPLQVTVESLGFKHGLPLDIDHVVDVCFLKNPYWADELHYLTGKDQAVADYVFSQPGACGFVLGYTDLLAPMLSGYLTKLKPFVAIAVGCTDGKHRSVASSEVIAERPCSRGCTVCMVHYDIGRD